MLTFPICTLQVRSYQRRDKRTASCSASPKAASAFHLSPWMSLCLTSTATKKKKKEFSQSSKGSWKGEKGCFVVFFCFFAPVLLSDFPHLVGEVQVFDSLKVAGVAWGGDSFTRRSLETSQATSQGRARWQLVNCQLVLITEAANLHPTEISCSTVLLHSL